MAGSSGPFAGLPRERRALALAALACAHVAVAVPMARAERRMRRAGGKGIIALEMTGTTTRAQRLLSRWGAEGRAAARVSLLLDYAYLATYAPFLAICTEAAAERLVRGGHPVAGALGGPLAWGQLAAGALDSVENAALLGVVAGRTAHPLPAVARACASVKFALVAAGIGYPLYGMLAVSASGR